MQATTSSLEALKAFSLGKKTVHEQGPMAALAHDQRAVELDLNFAMGYRGLGYDYWSLGELGRASEYFSKAFQLRNHASERERLLITAAYYANGTGELDKAARAYQEYFRSYPHDNEHHTDLGLVYGEQGQYQKALEEAHTAVLNNPNEVRARITVQFLPRQSSVRRGRAEHSRGAGTQNGCGNVPQRVVWHGVSEIGPRRLWKNSRNGLRRNRTMRTTVLRFAVGHRGIFRACRRAAAS